MEECHAPASTCRCEGRRRPAVASTPGPGATRRWSPGSWAAWPLPRVKRMIRAPSFVMDK